MSLQNESKGVSPHTIRKLKRSGLFAGAVAGLVVANGVLVRMDATDEAKTWSAEQSIPVVSVVYPTPSKGGNQLTLPGSVQAYYSAPIYARVPGYVKAWKQDIGARVRRGEVLAEIDTPEVDQQIAQARADLANAEAAHKQSASTAQRWDRLVQIGAVSRQDAEEKASDAEVKDALVKSQQANLSRLMTMKTFASIVAPFDGVVTERTVDIGALVNAGSSSASSPLFTIADMSKMRVYVRVPQNYSAQISDGLHASLTLPEYPGESFPARMVSASNAINNQSNTLLIQLEAANPKGKLKAGSYAQVTLQLPQDTQSLTVPVSALLFRADGLNVAAVGADDRVVLKPITVAADLGTTVQVDSGLSASDRVINNPPDSLQSGDMVRLAPSS